MEASLFLLLPVEDAVLDIPPNHDALVDLFAPLMRVKIFAREKNIRLSVYYDNENIDQFKSVAEILADDGTYLDKPYLILYNFVGKYSTDVRQVNMLDTSCHYVRWDTNTFSIDSNAPLVLKCAFESTNVSCVLSLSPKIPTDYYLVSIIKDRRFGEGLPKMKSIPLFFSADFCVQWLSSLLDDNFSLLRENVFQRTHYHWNNQCIFKNKLDDTYWYLDFFHKDNKFHYDVFNSEGKHLGEASSEGKLIEGTNDPSKSISHILHGH